MQMMSGCSIITKRPRVLLNILFPDVEPLSGIHFILLKISYKAISDKRDSGFHLLVIGCLSSEPRAACSLSYLA